MIKTSENSDPEINGRDRSARLAQMVEIALVYGTGHNRLRLMRNTVDCIQLRNRNSLCENNPHLICAAFQC